MRMKRLNQRSVTTAGGVNSVPFTIDTSDGETGMLGIRKTSLELDNVPLITPTSPKKFFNRLSPRRKTAAATSSSSYTTGNNSSALPPIMTKTSSSSHPATITPGRTKTVTITSVKENPTRLGIQRSPFQLGEMNEDFRTDTPQTEEMSNPSRGSDSSGSGVGGSSKSHTSTERLLPAVVSPISDQHVVRTQKIQTTTTSNEALSRHPSKRMQSLPLAREPPVLLKATIRPDTNTTANTTNSTIIENDNSSVSSSGITVRGKKSLPSQQQEQLPQEQPVEEDSPEKILHLPTAMGQYLENEPIHTPKGVKDLRYSLQNGTKSMTDEMKQRSKETVKKVRIKESRVLWSKSRSQTSLTETTKAPTAAVRAPTTDDKAKEPLVKIFLLLLQPEAKIFELIQLLYPPSITTIRDIINLIPTNATEPALGEQTYVGICRPKRRCTEITDLSLFASNVNVPNSAGIAQGEIFVAIPSGSTARHVVSLSKQILSNPRIKQLLEKSSPLAVRRKSRSDLVRALASRMEVVQEESEAIVESDVQENMKRARHAANQDNMSELMQDSLHSSFFLNPVNEDISEQSSLGISQSSYNSQTSLTSHRSHSRPVLGGQYEEDASLQGSLASWSKSVDSSMASTYQRQISSGASVASVRSLRSKRTRKIRNSHLRAGSFAVATVVYMIVRFHTDKTYQPPQDMELQPLGFVGMLQFLLSFACLLKLQRFIQRGTVGATSTGNQGSMRGGHDLVPQWVMSPPEM